MFHVMCVHARVWGMFLCPNILDALHINSTNPPSNMGVPKAIQTVKKDFTLCGWPLGFGESRKIK